MARDRYQWNIEGPQCGDSGKVHVSENDGWGWMKGNRDRHIQSVPQGFTVVDHGRSFGEETKIRCGCGSVATLSPP